MSFTSSFAANDNDIVRGQQLYKVGNYKEAADLYKAAYEKDKTNPARKLAYATMAPCSTAVKLYRELALSSLVPDSLRAVAYLRMGDYYSVIREYQKAVDNYKLASKFGNDEYARLFWARASFCAGDIETAQSIWHTLSLEYGDTISQIALYEMGLIGIKQEKYEQAYKNFLKTGTSEDVNSWATASLAAKYECAVKLGMSDKAQIYFDQLKPDLGSLLEKEHLKDLQIENKNPQSVSQAEQTEKETAASNNQGVFSLQVGAFGSSQNASALKQRLSATFKDMVVPVSLGEQVFYRVWVGTFRTREGAESFGADTLAKAGLSYRIVEK